ncbi:MAG: ABC transporter ATP-binding protein [Clostridia bacterium]|nr:ABC transporter ATP-binding protein [Clostridia bacterium]
MKLVIEKVSKLYGSFSALSNIEVSLDNGVYGLLGPNGAGKTTLMRIMTDLLKPSGGRVLLDGVDISVLGAEFRRRLGYLPQDFGFYPNYTAEQFLMYIARLKGLGKAEAKRQTAELLEMVGLAEKRGQQMKALSGGQRQRVGIAQALLGDPDILVLDEPTAGLDPEERIRFRGIISNLSRQKTVLLSTHIVSDLEAVAHEIILLKKGVIIDVEKPHELLRKIEGKVFSLTVPVEKEFEFASKYRCSNIMSEGASVVLRIVSDEKPHETAIPMAPNMEDLYVYYFK